MYKSLHNHRCLKTRLGFGQRPAARRSKGPTVNSQGREPLVDVANLDESPNGAKVRTMSAHALSSRWGFPFVTVRLPGAYAPDYLLSPLCDLRKWRPLLTTIFRLT